MTERLPNGSDGWVAPEEPAYLDDAQVLFLWNERVKDGRIKVWFDPLGTLHFHTTGHPGCTMDPPKIGFDHQGMPV